jgi:tripartite-type tricarboxylate transporter receptor subunit TctC
VGYAPGGLNDTLSRVVARHIGKKIPGQPNVVVRNMSSAGPIGIANHMYNAAEKDGSVIASLDRTGAQLAIRGELSARFDPLNFNWLGSVASFERDAYLLLVNANHPAKTAKDLQGGAMKAVIGSVGAGSTNQVFAMLAKDALKLNLDTIKGYRGTGPIFLAMQTGEVDGVVTGVSTLTTTQADLWNNRKIRALVQFGRATRHPLLPETPTLAELGQKGFTSEAWIGIFVPAGTVDGTVTRFNTELKAVLQDTWVRERMAAIGVQLTGSSPEQLGSFVKAEMARWGAVVRTHDIKPE